MKELFKFLSEVVKGITFYAKSSKDRATIKALLYANKAQRMDRRISSLLNKKIRNSNTVEKIQLFEKKKWEYWDRFNKYVAIN